MTLGEASEYWLISCLNDTASEDKPHLALQQMYIGNELISISNQTEELLRFHFAIKFTLAIRYAVDTHSFNRTQYDLRQRSY